MKMKQISDTTLKITMSLEDLMDRGMEIADFLVPQEKTEEFFYAILDELEMPDSFLDTGMLSFRVTPKPDKVDVFVTKSKIDQNLDFEDLADLPDMDELASISSLVFSAMVFSKVFKNSSGDIFANSSISGRSAKSSKSKFWSILDLVTKTSTLSGFGVTRKLSIPVSKKLSGISNSSRIA